MKWSEGGKFENPEPGSHLARCYAVVDLGSQTAVFNGESRTARKVRISFELPHSLMTGRYNAEVRGKPFTAHLYATQSLHPAATLRKLLEGWRGKRFEQVELENYDPAKLLGKCCRLTLIESETGAYVNIDSIAPARKDEIASMPAQVNKSIFFSLAPEEFNQNVFESLSDKTKEKIKSTPEWAFLQDPRNLNPDVADSESPGHGSDDSVVPF